MNRMDLYILRNVVGTALIALLVLVLLETFVTLLAELGKVGVGNYGLAEVTQYLLLTLPRRAYEAFPMAFLLGGLLGMGGLATTSELVAMRAAGRSQLQLVLAALKGGLVLSLLAMALGEFVAPGAEQAARELRAEARQQSVAVRGGRGFWARDGEDVVNVRAVHPGSRLADIYLYRLGADGALVSATVARAARHADDHWVLEGVARSVLEEGTVRVERADEERWDSALRPEMLDMLAADPEDLSVAALGGYIDYLEANGLDASAYRLAWWSRWVAPLSGLTMLFIAMPFAFAPQRAGGVGQRLMIGIFLGLGFFLANRLLGNAVLLYGYPPLLGAVLPTLVFAAGGAWALARMR